MLPFRAVGRRALTTQVETEAITKQLLSQKQVSVTTVDEWRAKAISATFHRASWLNEQQGHSQRVRLLPGWHQLFCLPTVNTHELSADGYEPDFAPPEPFIARMWGGSSITWEVDPSTNQPFGIHIGDTLQKTSFINDIKFKEGKKSGPLLILKLRHEYSRQNDQQALLAEETSMIYRTQALEAAPEDFLDKQNNYQDHNRGGQFQVVETQGESGREWRMDVMGSSVLLFRYSALTFNSHLIHYDQNYSQGEGFGAPLVHGPLQAQLLLDLVSRVQSKEPKTFSYRAIAPLENGKLFTLCAREKDNSAGLELQVISEDQVTMEGTIQF